jgi:hypothetical protein
MIVAVLMVASAVLFAVGVKIERGHAGSHVERTPAPESTSAAQASPSPAARPTIAPHDESGESAEHMAAEHAGESSNGSPQATAGPARSSRPEHRENGGETAEHQRTELAQRIFGINAEANSTVVAVLLVSAILALLVAAGSNPIVPLLVAAFAAVSALFDAAEVAHQLTEHRTNLVAIAAVVLHLHLSAAVGSLAIARRRTTSTLVSRNDVRLG